MNEKLWCVEDNSSRWLSVYVVSVASTIYLPYKWLHWPLIMWQVHGSDASITAGVDVELFEVTGLPHLHHAVISTCHQVVAITAQENSLQ